MIQYEQDLLDELQDRILPLVRNSDVDYISLSPKLNTWAKNKKAIYEMMGGKLRIEKKVSSSFSSREIQDLLFGVAQRFFREKEFALACWFLNTLKDEEVISNSLAFERNILGKKFNAGMKVSRVLLQLIPESSGARTRFQIEYSKVLELFTKDRTLVLSIHPLDFFMMSENTTGWRSCQSLDGQYKTATLAYLMDSATMVAYVLTDSGKKCWRQLIYVSTERPYAIQSRQYPTSNKTYNREASALIKEAFGWESASREKIDASYLMESDIILDKEANELWYNDILRESVDTVVAVYDDPEKLTFAEFIESSYTPIRVGVNSIKCLCGCGDLLINGEFLFAPCHFDIDYDEEWEE